MEIKKKSKKNSSRDIVMNSTHEVRLIVTSSLY